MNKIYPLAYMCECGWIGWNKEELKNCYKKSIKIQMTAMGGSPIHLGENNEI